MYKPDKKALPDFLSGKPRELTRSHGIKLRWPTKAGVADDYVATWLELARSILAEHRLSSETVKVIASHVSRRNGTLYLTDEAIASRANKRSVGSVKRDLTRCRTIGLLVAETVWDHETRRRQRCIYLSLPSDLEDRLNVSHSKKEGGSSQRMGNALRRLTLDGDRANVG